MKTIGLTGGIGAGKSTVARMLRHMGYPVYIADKEAARLTDTCPEIREALRKRFGAAAYTAQGTVDRPYLARVVFNDAAALADLNRIVHPRVMRDFGQWCRKQKATVVFFESAILFESGLDTFFDAVICVTAPEALRISRVVDRDGTTPERVAERVRNQSDDRLKCQKSGFVIRNDRNHLLSDQLWEILRQLHQ